MDLSNFFTNWTTIITSSIPFALTLLVKFTGDPEVAALDKKKIDINTFFTTIANFLFALLIVVSTISSFTILILEIPLFKKNGFQWIYFKYPGALLVIAGVLFVFWRHMNSQYTPELIIFRYKNKFFLLEKPVSQGYIVRELTTVEWGNVYSLPFRIFKEDFITDPETMFVHIEQKMFIKEISTIDHLERLFNYNENTNLK